MFCHSKMLKDQYGNKTANINVKKLVYLQVNGDVTHRKQQR